MGLSVQQQIVLENLSNNLKVSSETTDKMRSRASTVFAASAGLMSFASAGDLLSKGSAAQSAFIAASVLACAFVAIRSIGLYIPRGRMIPGCNSDAEQIRDQYLNVTEEESVNQIISDRASCFSDARALNSAVANSVKQMAYGFVVQVLCVACAVMLRAVALRL